MEAVLDNINPSISLQNKKQEEINSLIKEDLKNLDIELLKQILLENNIDYDNKLTSYKDLKKQLSSTLPREEFKKIEEQEKAAQKEIIEFMNEIQAGGPKTLLTSLNNISNKFVIPAAKTVATLGISRILFDAMLFLPCPVRTIAGATTVLGTTLVSKIAYAKHKREEKSKQYDKLLDELAEVKDENGKVIEEHFFPEQTKIIEDFFHEKGKDIKIIPYSNMMNEIHKLKNKDKLKLIEELNESLHNKIDINKELSRGRIKKRLKSVVSGIEKTALCVGVGMILSNLDKEIFNLALINLPEETKSSMFKARVTNQSVPKGLIAGAGIMGVRSLILSGINNFSNRNKIQQKDEKDENKKLNTNQKIAFEILKNREIYRHPEKEKEIREISTLGDYKKYVESLPIADQKEQINLSEKIKDMLDKKDAKEVAGSLGKVLGNSISLAGKSMLLYQLLLHLQLIVSPQNQNENSQENNPQPQEETVPEMATEHSPETSLSHETSKVTSQSPVTAPIGNGEDVVKIPNKSPIIAANKEPSEGISREDISNENTLMNEPLSEILKEKPYDSALNIPTFAVSHHEDTPKIPTIEIPENAITPNVSKVEFSESTVIPNEAVIAESSKNVIENNSMVDGVKKATMVAGTSAVVYFAVKGICAGISLLFPPSAPVLVPAAVLG